MNSTFCFSFFLSLAILQGQRAEQNLSSEKAFERLDSMLDMTYASYEGRTLKLDLYKPREKLGKLPAIVCIHGGGWAKGSRKSYTKVAQAIAAHGYVAVTISYRLSGEAVFPAAIMDCKAAVRFLRAHAQTLGINPDKIGAIGSSAGGHLAALLATSYGAEELEGSGGYAAFSSQIQAVVPMAAQTDFLSARNRQVSEERLIWKQFMGGTQEEKPDAYQLASPIEHLNFADPPCFLISGEMDDESTRAVKFRKRMNQLGISSELEIIEGAPHGFLKEQAWFKQAMEAAVAHFNRVLKGSSVSK